MNELALFAGAGGGILGGQLLGWRTVCAVEWDAYARDVLVARQNDGCLEAFPIWDDIQTFDGRPWRCRVDVVSGGFPCQDISAAGKGVGIDGERSGMWSHMARVIGEVQPRYVLVENSPLLVGRGLTRVLGDLAKMGYAASWGIVGAHHVGAPHKRDRIWIVGEMGNPSELLGDVCADYAGISEQSSQVSQSGNSGRQETVADSESTRLEGHRCDAGQPQITEPRNGSPLADSDSIDDADGGHGASSLCWEQGRESAELSGSEGDVADSESRESRQPTERQRWENPCGRSEEIAGDVADSDSIGGRAGATRQDGPETNDSSWWATEPDVGRVAHGVASRVDRLRCIGNGQVSAVVPIAWDALI